MNRVYWVDYAKAIGIVLVVFGHVWRGLNSAGMISNERLYLLVDSVIYSFHMPLFFFLSGLFVLGSYARRGATGIIFNKLDTIFYPYVIWSLIQGVIEASLSSYTNGNVSFKEVFSVWEPRAQFWFLYVLFFMFFVFLIFSFFKDKFFEFSVLTFSLLIYFLSPFFSWSLLNSFCVNFVFFCMGAFFYKRKFLNFFSSKWFLILSLCFFVFLEWTFHFYFNYIYTDIGLLSFLVSISAIFFIASLSSFLSEKPNGLLIFIGGSSMEIYLMHILAASGARIVLTRLFHVDSVAINLIFGVILGVVMPLFALKILRYFRMPYVFSAPIGEFLENLVKKIRRKDTSEAT